MTGPGAVLSRAASLASPAAGKPSNVAKVEEINPAAAGSFSELFAAVRGETEAPAPLDEETEIQWDESGDASQLPPPMPPEKTPQARFAEELSATLPPAGYGGVVAAPPITPPGTQTSAEVAVPPAAPPVPPAVGGNVAGAPASAFPNAVPPALPNAVPPAFPNAVPPALPLKAPAVPLRGAPERNAAKSLPQNTLAAGDPAALAAATADTDAVVASAKPATSDIRPDPDREGGDTARSLAALKDTKVTIIHQETHFAPVAPQSPAFQIANRISHEFATDPAFAPQSAALTRDASAAPVKVLEIQLDPPELGALMVRMSLKDNVLHLQIEASRHDTMKLIERDQDALSAMLRSAGYNIDGLTVQIATGDRGNNPQQPGGGFNPPAGQHSAERQPEGSGSGQASRSGGEPERTAEHGRETEAPGADERRGGLVYL